jgi:hypothetical protein
MMPPLEMILSATALPLQGPMRRGKNRGVHKSMSMSGGVGGHLSGRRVRLLTIVLPPSRLDVAVIALMMIAKV